MRSLPHWSCDANKLGGACGASVIRRTCGTFILGFLLLSLGFWYMRLDVIAVMPKMLESLHFGVIGRAADAGYISIHTWNPRDYSDNVHRTVDDRPYGGGAGMVMMAKPLSLALESARNHQNGTFKVIYLSPQGVRFSHSLARSLAKLDGLVFVAGRYSGVDVRFIEQNIDLEISLGDYVISGGELAVMVLIDAITRQIAGVLGNSESLECDSFSRGLLEYPHYTRPENYMGMRVPEVLLGGNHDSIRDWRLQQALGRTYQIRPDLLEDRGCDAKEQALLEEYLKNH